MASPYSTPSHAVIVSPYANEEPMPAGATGTLFLLASGFGIGALVILFAFVFLIGIGGVGHNATSGPTAAQQSAATAPAAPGPAPNPAPNTGGGTVPETTGQAPAPANPSTPRAPTQDSSRSSAPIIAAFVMAAACPAIDVGRPVGLLNPDGISRAGGARQRCAAPCR